MPSIRDTPPLRGTGEAPPLRGTSILIVEDEVIVACDLALSIEDGGGEVFGPLHSLKQALALDDLGKLDAAILDVDLSGDEVFEFADRLRERRVPFVFHTGRSDLTRLHADYPEAPIVRKPCAGMQLVRAVSRALALEPADTVRGRAALS